MTEIGPRRVAAAHHTATCVPVAHHAVAAAHHIVCVVAPAHHTIACVAAVAAGHHRRKAIHHGVVYEAHDA
jgi:hypothetical protein